MSYEDHPRLRRRSGKKGGYFTRMAKWGQTRPGSGAYTSRGAPSSPFDEIRHATQGLSMAAMLTDPLMDPVDIRSAAMLIPVDIRSELKLLNIQ